MPEYLSPEFNIEEIRGAQPIEGVSTSVTDFRAHAMGLSMGIRRPCDQFPRLTRNVRSYSRRFAHFRVHFTSPAARCGGFLRHHGGKLRYSKG